MTSFLFAALALFATFAPQSARAEILCRRDAEITPVLPQFDADDLCSGTVKLQGISFKCAKPTEYDEDMHSFLEDLASNGREFCNSYCAKRAPGCVGRFDEPTHCGWSVPRSEVDHVGKEAPCSDSCPGKSFIYCSIYHGSYLRVEERMFTDVRPNCRCVHGK